MAKADKTAFVCTDCGDSSPRWQGQCKCGAWNTMQEIKVSSIKSASRALLELQVMLG